MLPKRQHQEELVGGMGVRRTTRECYAGCCSTNVGKSPRSVVLQWPQALALRAPRSPAAPNYFEAMEQQPHEVPWLAFDCSGGRLSPLAIEDLFADGRDNNTQLVSASSPAMPVLPAQQCTPTYRLTFFFFFDELAATGCRPYPGDVGRLAEAPTGHP
jgi:hypothetical protein